MTTFPFAFRATDIARSMIKEYGMSSRLGQVYFAGNKQNRFLNPVSENRGEYSEVTANLIDREVQQITDEQYSRALDILRQKRHVLDNAVKVLLKNEVIEGEDLSALAETISKETDGGESSDEPRDRITLAA